MSGELTTNLRLDRLSKQFHLNWSHYQILSGLKNSDERRFYEIKASVNQWRVRELERQIAAALFERLAFTVYNGDLTGRIVSVNADKWPPQHFQQALEM